MSIVHLYVVMLEQVCYFSYSLYCLYIMTRWNMSFGMETVGMCFLFGKTG